MRKRIRVITRIMGIVPCSGETSIGEISREASVNVCKEYRDICQLFSLTKMAVDSVCGCDGSPPAALKGKKVIAVDGCESSCATRMLECLGIHPDGTVEVGKLLGKGHGELTDVTKEDVETVVSGIEEVLEDLINKSITCIYFEKPYLDKICHPCSMSRLCFNLKRVEMEIKNKRSKAR
ncbi:MAG: putative zinc-binding protein [Candidatus Syntropharchaeia archaeon]